MQSETIGKLAEAMAKAQGQMGHAMKSSANPFFKSKYADLATVIEAIRDPLSKNNLSYTQMVDYVDGIMMLRTTLMHSSGEYQQSLYPIEPVKKDPQGYGSAITYARRYGLSAAVGLAQDDDDGNAASQTKAPTVTISKQEKETVYTQTITAIANNDKLGLDEIWSEWDNDHKVVLWGMFNSQERAAIKKLQAESA